MATCHPSIPNSAAAKYGLAPGSNVTFEPAFNGAGFRALELNDVGLNDATNDYLDKCGFGFFFRPMRVKAERCRACFVADSRSSTWCGAHV